MICRRVHGQWSVGWKFSSNGNDWCNRGGLYVNNFYGEELLITIDKKRNQVVIFEISPEINSIWLKKFEVLKSIDEVKHWLTEEIPLCNSEEFDEGCWMEASLKDIGWQ